MNYDLSDKFRLLKSKKEYENVFELFDEKNNVYPSGDIVYNVTKKYADFVTYYNLLMEQNSEILEYYQKNEKFNDWNDEISNMCNEL